jgi:hypothetical protein
MGRSEMETQDPTMIQGRIRLILWVNEDAIVMYSDGLYEICDISQYLFIDDTDLLIYATGDHMESDPAYSKYHLLIQDQLPASKKRSGDPPISHGKEWKRTRARLTDALTQYFQSKAEGKSTSKDTP